MISRGILPLAALLVLAAVVSALAGEQEEWLAENGAKPDVVKLPSGLQYKVLRQGEGAFHPTVDSPCECHYKCVPSIPSLLPALPLLACALGGGWERYTCRSEPGENSGEALMECALPGQGDAH